MRERILSLLFAGMLIAGPVGVTLADDGKMDEPNPAPKIIDLTIFKPDAVAELE